MDTCKRPLAVLVGAVALHATGQTQAATTTPGAADSTIAFEAEIGTIDNQFDNPSLGWAIDVGTAPSNPSGGSYVTNAEDTTGGAPTNKLTYTIDFQKTGSYTLWYRVAYTTFDFEDTRDSTGNNDSFYYENGGIGNASTFREQNGIPGMSTAAWNWQPGPTNDITVGAAGVRDWVVTGREDGFIIDRFALVHSSESNTVNAAFLDSLANTPVPEPGSLALLGLGGLLIARRRRG